LASPRRLATVHNYHELHAALRARAAELRITREAIDAVAGLQGGYPAKALAPIPSQEDFTVAAGLMIDAYSYHSYYRVTAISAVERFIHWAGTLFRG
jgi:hypothetical protein